MKSTGTAFLLFIFISSLVNAEETSGENSATPAAHNGTTATTVTPTSGGSTIPNTSAYVSTTRTGPTDNPASSTTANTTQKNNETGPTDNPASSTTANTTQKNNGTIFLKGRTHNKISDFQAVDNTFRDNSASPSISTIPAAHNGLDSAMTRTTSSTASTPPTSNHKILWVMLPVLIALVGIVLIVMKFKCFTDKNNEDASENDTENVSKDGIILLGMKKPGEETGAR
ncbi:UNVERIFIED_CONTAM: hypothetical protein FKN15_015406 [Acipenser sinensis]